MTPSTAAIVGREHEQHLAEQLLEETVAGAPRIVFVTGEPGIGKTSLLDELIGSAEQRGCLALRGSAAEFEQELPFGLVVDALDEYLGSLEPRAFSRVASEDLSEIAGVFPALRSLAPGSPGPTTAAERFRAHHALRDLIERLAGPQPMVLVLEDLHWADGASIELVSHLLRRPPQAAVLVAASFRTGQVDRGLAAAIVAAEADGDTVRRVELGPLTQIAANELVDAAGAAELEQLYRASGGNPFYMLQLARAEPPAVMALVAARRSLQRSSRRSSPNSMGSRAALAGSPRPRRSPATRSNSTWPSRRQAWRNPTRSMRSTSWQPAISSVPARCRGASASGIRSCAARCTSRPPPGRASKPTGAPRPPWPSAGHRPPHERITSPSRLTTGTRRRSPSSAKQERAPPGERRQARLSGTRSLWACCLPRRRLPSESSC